MQRPELVNFCLTPFLKHCGTTTVCADGYLPSNLASTSMPARDKGFRVEHFIRTPVQLEFQFAAPVDVACVLVEPGLLPESEIRMELSGSFGYGERQYLFKPFGSIVGKGNNSVLIMRNRSFEGNHGEIQFSEEVSVLGSCMTSRLDCLQRIVQPLKYSPILRKLTILRIDITRYTGIRPVSLKALEIWGTLSLACSTEEREAAGKTLSGLRAQPPSGNSAESWGVYSVHKSCLSEMQLAGHSLAPLLISANKLPKKTNPNQSHCPDMYTTGHAQHQKCISAREESEASWSGPSTSTSGSLEIASGHLSHQRMEEKEHMHGLVGRKDFQLTTHSRFNQLAWTGNPAKIQSRNVKEKPHHHQNLLAGTREALRGTFSSGGQSGVEETCLSGKSPLQVQTSSSNLIISSPLQKNAPDFPLQMKSAINMSVAESPPAHSKAVPQTPDRFLDEITYDIMTIPMLLPSGHYVDRSTLDRVVQSDASYGRSPSDPFTGVPFTNTSEPKFCAELKAQIDRLLSAKEDSFAGSGRSLGSASDITKHLQRQAAGVKRTASPVVGKDSGSKRPRHSLEAESHFADRKCKVQTCHCAGSSEHLTSQGKESLWQGASMDDQMTTSRMSDHTHEVELQDSLNKALHNLFPAQ